MTMRRGWRSRAYFGASTITIWRPSIEGSASTLAIMPVSIFTRSSRRKPKILMGHFAATKAKRHLDLVAFFEEAAHGLHFGVVVMVVDAGAKLDLLDLDDLLLLAGFGGFLLLKEAELPVVEDLADRRIGGGDDLDEVEACVVGYLLGFQHRDDPSILAFRVDQLNFTGADFTVDARPVLLRDRWGFHGTANGLISFMVIDLIRLRANRVERPPHRQTDPAKTSVDCRSKSMRLSLGVEFDCPNIEQIKAKQAINASVFARRRISVERLRPSALDREARLDMRARPQRKPVARGRAKAERRAQRICERLRV